MQTTLNRMVAVIPVIQFGSEFNYIALNEYLLILGLLIKEIRVSWFTNIYIYIYIYMS